MSSVTMAPVTVNFYYPNLNPKRKPTEQRLVRESDGDTVYIEQGVRLVSIDTPEKAAYAGKPAVSQPKLELCRTRLQNGFYAALPSDLRYYLVKKLTSDAAEKHINAANGATAALNAFIEDRLTKPDGSQRKLGVLPTGQLLDEYGRLLAYITPWYSGSSTDPVPPKPDPRRYTFNLNMIASGWAPFFPIYPSLPGNFDMNLAIAAAEDAWNKKLGAWHVSGANLLLGYEYRACIKLAQAENAQEGIEEAFRRICIDMRTMKNVGEFGFWNVPPCYRLWVWKDDIAKAKADLKFT